MMSRKLPNIGRSENGRGAPRGVWSFIPITIPIIVTLLGAFPVGVVHAGVDEALGDLYLTQAVQFYESGDLQRAEELLAAAREFSPELSDVYALSVMLAGGMRTPWVDPVLSACLQALDSTTWRYFSSVEIRKIAVGLYLRIGEYQSAIVLAEEGGGEFLEDPEAALFHARALYGGGRKTEARRLVSRYAKGHPEHAGLMTFRCRIDAAYRRQLESLTLAGRVTPGLDAIAEMIIASPEEKTRRALIELFPKTAEVYPLIFIESLRLAESITDSDIRMFVDSGWVYNLSALHIMHGILSEEHRDELESLVIEVSGEMFRDKNRDGFSERRVSVVDGVVQRVELDENQNGIPEVDITFRTGVPVEVSYREECPDCRIRMEFEPYPQVKTLELLPESNDYGDSFSFLHLPEYLSNRVPVDHEENDDDMVGVTALVANLASMAEGASSAGVASSTGGSEPAEGTLPADSASSSEFQSPAHILVHNSVAAHFSAGTFGYEFVFLQGGPYAPFVEIRRGVQSGLLRSVLPRAVNIRLAQEDMLYLQGERRKVLESRDEIGKARTIFSSDGSVERRMRDFDGDGDYEMYSEYTASNSRLHSFDLNNNDVFEFRRHEGESPMSEWDFDEDGTVDCREYTNEDGTIRREYLFAGDIAPIVVESLNGRVLSIEREGVRRSVVSSPNTGVIWIGTIPNPEPELPVEGEGFGIFSGTTVRYFNLTGKIYAEVVK